MKKRVVGAVVLVIIGVALPLLLVRCLQGGSGDEDAMRVYEIAPDGQTRPASAAANAPESQPATDESALDGASGVNEREAEQAPVMPEAVSPAASDTAPASQPAEPNGAASTPEPEPAASSGNLRQRQSFGGGWVVQVASFRDEVNAERLAGDLNGEFKAFYRAGDVNGTTYYRVRVGPFDSEAGANQAAARLRERGRATLVRRAE